VLAAADQLSLQFAGSLLGTNRRCDREQMVQGVVSCRVEVSSRVDRGEKPNSSSVTRSTPTYPAWMRGRTTSAIGS